MLPATQAGFKSNAYIQLDGHGVHVHAHQLDITAAQRTACSLDTLALLLAHAHRLLVDDMLLVEACNSLLIYC